MKSLLAQEMSKQKEPKKRSPSIIARLMGLDVLPSAQSSSHRKHTSVENQKQGKSGEGTSYKSLARSSKGGEQKFKDVFEVLDAKKAESSRNLNHQAANLTPAEMAFIRQKFMEAKRLSTDEKLRHSKEFNDALEALDSNKDLLLKFLQQPDSLFTKHLHDLQTTPHKKSPNIQRHVDSLKTQKVDKDLLWKSHRSPHQHGGGGCHSHSHSRHASYDTLDLHPTNIVVLKPNLGEPRYASRAFASPSSSSDEFRADRRLPCTSRQKSNEDIRLSRHSSRDSGEFSQIMSRQRKASRGNNGSSVTSFETSGFKGYAGDESSSGSDSPSESELVPITSRTRTAFNRKNYQRSTTSSVTREAKRRLSERWKLTHKYEQEIEIRRSGTLAEMLATSDREARPASFNGLVFEEEISKRVEWTELPEPVGISSRDGWKGLSSRSFSKSKTIMNQESTYGYTIVLPKELNYRDGLAKGSSSHHGESQSYLSSKSSRHGSYKSHSSYNSSPEVNMSPSLTKFLYQKEKVSPSKSRYSFSVDANSDTEDDSSASDDMKTAMSSEAPDLSTVTSLTDPDISRMPTEDVNRSSVPDPQSREGSKEGDQPSPVSVLETSFDDDVSSSSECFESVSADLQGISISAGLVH
ncbi:Afadin [Hirschfeldia incana]|nr:Afadin [Hirschfeldia incana]